ncbi:small ribosomal subunit protein mS39 [Lithobates pipiens]
MALPCVRLGAVGLRSWALYRFLCRSSSHQAAAAAEEIDIPKKKTWAKTAVLQALAYTVNHDPTSAGYSFQDDPYLLPSSSADYNLYSMSLESGRNAAKYIVNMYPNLFESNIAEPQIPFLMPENVQPQIEGISEEALTERIKLRNIKASVDLYDQLLQAGTPPFLETTNKLLDLLCFYGDREPASERQTNPDEENGNGNGQKSLGFQNMAEVKRWSDNNNAERIFNLMPEKDAHSFRTMIRGMVKHSAFTKAFDMYTDLLNNRLTGDVHTFNALITAVPRVKQDSREKWALIVDLLYQMVQQNVQPNLHTFNSILKSLKKTGPKVIAMQTFNEMKALNIEPSLATFYHLLAVFYRPGDATEQAEILSEILQTIQGKCFTAQDRDDVRFFGEAIRVCLDTKDIDLAYQLDAVKNTGDNWKIGDRTNNNYYYSKFFNLICLLENIDVVLKWYRENVPSRFYLQVQGIVDLLQVVEMENRFELLPQIWKDVHIIGHSNKHQLLKEFLKIMTREKQNPELQNEFANIAASIKSIYEAADRSSLQLKPSAAVLGDIAILLYRAGRSEETWATLKLFRSQNLVPGFHVIEELLDCARASGSTSVAFDLVQLAVSYGLPNTAKLAHTMLDEFTLSEEQRIILQDLTPKSGSSTSSSSDSDQD